MIGERPFKIGEVYFTKIKDLQEDTTDTAYAWWQPALWFEYYDGDKLLKTTDDYYKDTAIPSYEPEKKDGMKFIGWADKDGNLYAEDQIFKVPEITKDNGNVGPVKLYAKWKENSAPYVPVTPSTPTEEHTVTFHPNNGESNFTQTVPDGGKAVQPEDPAQEGYTFDGWFTDSSLTQAYDFNTPVKGNLDLYAKWTKTVKPVNPVKPVKPSRKVTGILLPKVIANGSSEQTFTWTPLTNVDGYFVYEAYCNTYKNVHPFKKVADVSASSPRVYKRSGLKKGAAYKYYVAAYQIKDGKKQIVKKSVTVHSAAGNLLKTKKAAYTNVKNVSVKKNAVTLKIGKTYKIQPSVKGVYSGYAILQKSHAPMYRYLYIKDGKNISVDQNGNVKALKAGKCNVYVLGTNGVRTKVAVTVK
ncbi:InlB B-repeat-containing protein [Eubacterium sp. F2]|uniref:InlB B-repeat-containing protein n=1 Tax=Eubacterium sp. F2 TaxID=3381348 RepID=UPI00390803F3